MNVIDATSFGTPLGEMTVCATGKGICLFEFSDRRMLNTEFSDLKKHLKSEIRIGENKFFPVLKRQMLEYFEGKRKEFDLPLHTPGTEFQNKVWQELIRIPYGRTRSYLEQAKTLGDPKAIRAVAGANGANRIAIIIPCHRVIGSDGSMTGYGGKVWRKKWLLEHEQGIKELFS